jgi:hypothetical protein
MKTAALANQCRFCTEELPQGARQCPLCLRNVDEDDVYELPAVTPELARMAESLGLSLDQAASTDGTDGTDEPDITTTARPI